MSSFFFFFLNICVTMFGDTSSKMRPQVTAVCSKGRFEHFKQFVTTLYLYFEQGGGFFFCIFPTTICVLPPGGKILPLRAHQKGV